MPFFLKQGCRRVDALPADPTPHSRGRRPLFLLVALALLLYRRLARGGATRTAPDAPPPPARALRRFSYSELRRATASFAPSHRLGHGGFGPVFRGALPSGEEVAVKMMNSCGSLQGEHEFYNELTLASRILSMHSASAARVVPAIGYCCDDGDRRRRWWRLWRRRGEEEPPEAQESPTAAPGRKLLLVYKLMPNGSLQDALLDHRCPQLMDWEQRFAVVLDIARSLDFLHAGCEFPVIHGDIKPSNILLDDSLSAKIADFGLAQLVSTSEMVVDVDSEKSVHNTEGSVKQRKKDLVVEGREDSASVAAMGETAGSMTTETGFEDCGAKGALVSERSLQEDEASEVASPATTVEVASASEASALFDRASVDSEKDPMTLGCRKGSRRKKSWASLSKDWWRRQDIRSGESNSESGGDVKDYVMEWIQTEFKESPKHNWIAASSATSSEQFLLKSLNSEGLGQKKTNRQWWTSLYQDKVTKKEKRQITGKWWQEFDEDVTNKLKPLSLTKSKSINYECREQQLRQNVEAFTSSSEKKRKKKSSSHGGHSSTHTWMDRISGEIRTTAKRNCQDWASMNIPKSGTMSSTPSTRGTICYVAPEHGGGKPLSEKCDVYSFGVLLLVIIAGRRPLKMTTSSMSKYEQAHLISWARRLAHLGRLMDLVDPCLRCVDSEQALLCITVATLCLQRSPSARPTSKEILSMLTGESKPPVLPIEFSQSPPCGFSLKSRKKARGDKENRTLQRIRITVVVRDYYITLEP
ncbi:hypothetical protein Cni_G25555 [Canna indica]|uniref:non-specific serine/threonine protein kinase n=1 Tax=Canna indica TaxID=4628 RepID=A0AAQ3L222_9LILI|nr:hypothetical protein Cni_G25555 [Canna indica]